VVGPGNFLMIFLCYPEHILEILSYYIDCSILPQCFDAGGL